MTLHKAAGGCCNMLTLTCPHQLKDRLADLLKNQAKALNSFWADRHVKAVLVEMGTVGQVRALEPTHGRLSEKNNGWHPHYHIVLFQGVNVDLSRFDAPQMRDWEVRLYLRWANACKLAGLGMPSLEHGLKLTDGEDAAKYVTKWGLEDEMTKGHTKKAINGETPFDFLRAYLADPEDKQALALFKEYAETFRGKRQLHWSKGLKKRFAIGEKSDEQLANEEVDEAVCLGQITIEQWRDVLAVNGRGLVLQLAAAGGWDAVTVYLASIKREFSEASNDLQKRIDLGLNIPTPKKFKPSKARVKKLQVDTENMRVLTGERVNNMEGEEVRLKAFRTRYPAINERANGGDPLAGWDRGNRSFVAVQKDEKLKHTMNS
jgi:hypothetical protein